MEKIKKIFKEHKKAMGFIIILIGVVVACAINLLWQIMIHKVNNAEYTVIPMIIGLVFSMFLRK